MNLSKEQLVSLMLDICKKSEEMTEITTTEIVKDIVMQIKREANLA
jgi:hypothetical protein